MADVNSISTKIFIPLSEDLASKPDFNLVGYDNDLTRVSEILMQTDADNALVVGAAGVGKQALLLGIEQRRQTKDISLKMLSRHIVRLDLPNLLASRDSGDMERRFTQELDEHAARGNTTVVIPNLPAFLKAIGQKSADSIYNIFLGRLKKSRLQAIAFVDSKQRAELFTEHPELREQFTVHEMKEPDAEKNLHILRGMRPHYEVSHGVKITDHALQTIVDISIKYKALIDENLSHPGVSTRLLDRILSQFMVKNTTKPAELQALEVEIGNLTNEQTVLQDEKVTTNQDRLDEIRDRLAEIQPEQKKQAAAWSSKTSKVDELLAKQSKLEREIAISQQAAEELREQDTTESDEAATQREQLIALTKKQLRSVNEQLVEMQKTETLTFHHTDVLQGFSAIYGVPLDQLTENNKEKLLKSEEYLNKKVFGQPAATSAVAGTVMASGAGLSDPKKPKGSFLFQGPSGSGKTQLVLALAEFLTGDADNMVRVDMSEFMEKHSVARLIGAPPGYAGHDEGGMLTEAVRKRPYAVILLDEVEKAHPDVFNILLQVLDAGRLTDGFGTTVLFNNTYVVMTSNVGSAHFLNRDLSFEEADRKAKEDLRAQYKPEFLNRVTAIVGFQSLGVESLFNIAGREVSTLNKRLKDSNIRIEPVGDCLRDLCEAVYDPAKNGRAVVNYMEKNVQKPVAKIVLCAGANDEPKIIKFSFKSLDVPPTLDIVADPNPPNGNRRKRSPDHQPAGAH